MKKFLNNTEMNKIAYDTFAQKYYNDFFNEWEGKEYVDEFLHCLGGKRILDLGCGNGNFAFYAKQKGFEVKGYDISEEMIKLGKQTCPSLDISVQDITLLPKEKNLFDGAIYSYSFMHLTKQQAKNSLNSLFPNLKPKAKLCIMTCKGSGEKLVAYDEYSPNKKILFTFYEENEIIKLLSDCGFKILSMKIKHEENANVSNEDWIILAEK